MARQPQVYISIEIDVDRNDKHIGGSVMSRASNIFLTIVHQFGFLLSYGLESKVDHSEASLAVLLACK
jgi:hypothetical protein